MKFHQSQTQVLSPRFLCACGRQDNACRNMAPPGITPETRCVFRTSETCLRTAGSRKQMPERTCACSGTADATSWSAYEEPRPCRWRPYGRNAERLMRPLPQARPHSLPLRKKLSRPCPVLRCPSFFRAVAGAGRNNALPSAPFRLLLRPGAAVFSS